MLQAAWPDPVMGTSKRVAPPLLSSDWMGRSPQGTLGSHLPEPGSPDTGPSPSPASWGQGGAQFSVQQTRYPEMNVAFGWRRW